MFFLETAKKNRRFSTNLRPNNQIFITFSYSLTFKPRLLSVVLRSIR